jgi:hypothetical protein
MIHVVRLVGQATGISAIALILTASPATASRPPPEGPSPPATAQRVEAPVRVPVDDTTAEILQMEVAAALGAAVGAGVTAARLRRRRYRCAGTGFIDLAGTEPVALPSRD